MLSRKYRLSRKDFLLTKKHGKKATSYNFSIVLYQPSTTDYQQFCKFSVVTSTKLSKKAVVRNRLRRMIYHQLSIFHYPFSINIIVYLKPSVLNLSGEEINTELDSLLSKIHSQN